MDARAEEGATRTVKSVLFTFLTTDEIRKMSVKKITSPQQFDVMGVPIPGGLYDPAMGTLSDADSCKTCGQNYSRCPGHCGHVDLALPVYNPLLLSTLRNLLHITCFYCYKFTISKKKVQLYARQLDLIIKGDIAAYKMLGENLFDVRKESMDEELNHIDGGKQQFNIDSGQCDTFPSKDSCLKSKNCKTPSWTSLQQTEATSLLHTLLGERPKKCHNCQSKNPAISMPVYGKILLELSNSEIRSNVIRGATVGDLASELSAGNVSENTTVKKSLSGKRSSKMLKIEPHAEHAKQMEFFSGELLPSKARFILKNLWSNETTLSMLICDIQQRNTCSSSQKNFDIFFIHALLVPPSRFRPPSRGGGDSGQALENPQNALLARVVESNIALQGVSKNPNTYSEKVKKCSILQTAVNVLFDSSRGYGEDKDTPGLRQLLEKKAGVLRQKMMGKRVNFACRSVISPDPYLAVNEIGIPPQFAMKLTYPERVTTCNVDKLRHAIINGTEYHPGATLYKEKDMIYNLARLSMNTRISISRKLSTSRGIHAATAKSPDTEFDGKLVHRLLKDGDVVLVNRQPTLHKPSMKAHIVRVLKGERTLRFHYANCSSYNADFDGDEMNVHLPQDEISRAEALNIVDANRQFIVPTSGKPDRGLIQDHIVSAVLLTKIDTFLTCDEFQELLYASLVPDMASGFSSYKSGSKVSSFPSNCMTELLPPCIWKPVPLWSGKQVITAVLNRVTRGHPAFSIKKTGKIPLKFLGDQKIFKKESVVRIDRNEFLYGVIDKEQFTMYGLVHTVYELYGPDAAGILLSSFSRLFTVFLQMHGFTCGLDDLLVVPKSEKKRKSILKRSEKNSEQAHKDFAGVNKDVDIDPFELQIKIEKALRLNGEAATAVLDRKMSNAMNELTSKVNEASIPNGLQKPFARNCVSLMTTTGAKGSLVNFTQISSLLGQQSLEGKRVPRMVSGKTLPCFPPYDTSSRSGGFISDRFLTGLRPQEYYFHCMAGREGLVDTAIKTSRSGYLQRCLIKNLESLKVCYDQTVRDVDGSIVSFVYGEDGVDTHNTSFLRQFKTLASNHKVIFQRLGGGNQDTDKSIVDIPDKLRNDSEKYFDKYSEKNHGKRGNKKLAGPQLLRKDDFKKLMEIKYLTSLVPPGEAVGVLAAQSVGEPSTQMTLNTFHLAGRGEVNVTLGIPRLQEILMSAKVKIKTPTMTCLMHKEMTREDAESIAAKLRRITVADITESMEICIVPFLVSGKHVSTLYKLKIRLYAPELYPPGSGLSLEDCVACLEEDFTVALDIAIKKQLDALSKISGIQVGSGMEQTVFDEGKDEDKNSGKSNRKMENDDESNDEDDMEDEGADGQKRKMQGRDEVEYDDDIEKESTNINNEVGDEMPSGFESEIDQVDDDYEDYTMAERNQETDPGAGDEDSIEEGKQVDSESSQKAKSSKDKTLKTEEKTSSQPKKKRKGKKKLERIVFVETKGLELEAHLIFENESHILLSEIAQRTAKNVFIRQLSNIEQCLVVEKKDQGATHYELQTAGVNFPVFWDLEKYLDIHQIKSNDIHAILQTYGVEAARQTIIDEVTSLFNAYGVSVGPRHLSLIADYMTFNGDYRPMNRAGMASYSTSPFGKITFETATKFIIEAALHGEVDTLEGPSSSICLGQPVKMGTGCFDLLHNLNI